MSCLAAAEIITSPPVITATSRIAVWMCTGIRSTKALARNAPGNGDRADQKQRRAPASVPEGLIGMETLLRPSGFRNAQHDVDQNTERCPADQADTQHRSDHQCHLGGTPHRVENHAGTEHHAHGNAPH